MRHVKFRLWENGAWSEQYSGIFHQWGSDIIEYADGFVQRSVAIVERPDGSVVLIDPEKLQFINDF